jgi:hypothetical protein
MALPGSSRTHQRYVLDIHLAESLQKKSPANLTSLFHSPPAVSLFPRAHHDDEGSEESKANSRSRKPGAPAE